jgi:mono/diheme cytochrome c family protein
MRILLRTAIAIGGLLALAVAGAWAYFFLWLPRDIPVPQVSVAMTPERIERGRYLANQVMSCTYCHSGRDWAYFSGPIAEGQLGRGGEVFDERVGFPGRLIAANLTPSGLGTWSDGEILRAMTGGLSRDGHALFPVMPYDSYRKLSPADAEAVVAYLRSLPAVPAPPAGKRVLNFPLNFIVNAIPSKPEPRAVDPADKVAYGEYLMSLSGCAFCHTPVDSRQRAIPGMRLAGGRPWPVNGVMVRSSNISPDRETGLGTWSLGKFIERFRRYQGPAGRIRASEVGYNTQMPWLLYADLTDADLEAMYAYIMQSKPVRNAVRVVD